MLTGWLNSVGGSDTVVHQTPWASPESGVYACLPSTRRRQKTLEYGARNSACD